MAIRPGTEGNQVKITGCAGLTESDVGAETASRF
jgi:hypothetical protein